MGLARFPTHTLRRGRPLAWTLLAVLGSASCSDSQGRDLSPTTPTPPPGPVVPAAFGLALPDSVPLGESFAVEILALRTDGGVETGWSGSVELTVSAGTVSPGSAPVQGGRVTVQLVLAGHLGSVDVTARGAGVEGRRTIHVFNTAPPVSLAIEPAGLLLPGSGAEYRLRAVGYDAAGLPTRVAATWISSAPGIVSVGEDGTARAVGPAGSATIQAVAGALQSPSIMAVVATPADGALLVPDEAVTVGPAPLDPEAEYEPGWEYSVTLRGYEPHVGQILLGTGGIPLGGRVTNVSGEGEERRVTIALVPLDELFRTLVIRESLPVGEGELVLPESVDREYRVFRGLDGTLHFEPRGTPAVHRAGGIGPASANEFPLGPFTCSISGQFSLPSLSASDGFRLKPDLSLEVDYDSEAGGLRRLVLTGAVEVDTDLRLMLSTSVGGGVSCSRTLATFQLPFGGPLALIFTGAVDLRIGFGATGTVNLASVGWELKSKLRGEGSVGVDCQGGCSMVTEMEVDPASASIVGRPTGSLAGVYDPFKLNVRGSVNGEAVLKFGNPFFKALQFDALKMAVGPVQAFDLASPMTQVEFPDYRSKYSTHLEWSLGAGSGIKVLEGLLRISFAQVSVKRQLHLAESPSGTFSITPSSVRPGNQEGLGEMATFTVELDPITYLGAHAVEEVLIFWLREDEEGSLRLDPGRPLCNTLPASPGQTTFTCTADFLEEHEGIQTFVAFVRARVFGASFPVLLQVGKNSKAQVEVAQGTAVALRHYSVFAFAETGLEAGSPFSPIRVFGERVADEIRCPPIQGCDLTGGTVSGSVQGSGSFEAISGVGSASGSGRIELETRGPGAVQPPSDTLFIGTLHSVTYFGSGAASMSVSGPPEEYKRGRTSGGSGASVRFNVREGPVRYVLTVSGGEGSSVRLQRPDAMIFDFSGADGSGEDETASASGVLEPGQYSIDAFGFQAQDERPAYGSGSVAFTLIFLPPKPEG
jgi:hypothetical protein